MTNQFFRPQIIKFILFTLVIAALHFLLLKNFLPALYWEAKPWIIYAFLLPAEIVGLYFVFYRYKKEHTAALKSYLLFLVVKMASAIAFLSPWIFEKDIYTEVFIYQFFAVFFPLLFAELAFLVKMLNLELEKKEKN